MRLDLATVGFCVAPPQPLTDEDQGGVAVYIDGGHVVVDWLPHARLDHADSPRPTPTAQDDEDAVRYWAVRRVMDTALRTILAGFRYLTRRQPHPRLGHLIGQSPTTPDFQSNPVHDRVKTPLPATGNDAALIADALLVSSHIGRTLTRRGEI
ncbi:hypothetical protein ACFCZQ_09690 [Streptomyces virginiae]|uniref:hypothetical protein n=1 Tax=Streptomyces virginiae TaxID=1961 RepID=UPI0035D7C1C9